MTIDPIEIKTVGMLADELTVTMIKRAYGINVGDRVIRLGDAIARRIGEHYYSGNNRFNELFSQLKKINVKCWEFQDVVMTANESHIVANAARDAQKANAERNKVIRQIDELFGLIDSSYLEKNYE